VWLFNISSKTTLALSMGVFLICLALAYELVLYLYNLFNKNNNESNH
jgi:hypothetical protein